MKKVNYLIRCLTNTHVGSGDANFGVIDNQVQRDVLNEVPTIHGSSLKGALREHFRDKLDKSEVNHIFGSDDNNKPNSGKYKFLQPALLGLPLRSTKQAYFMASCPMLLKEFSQAVKLNKELLAIPENTKPVVFCDPNGLYIEDFESFEKKGESLVAELSVYLGTENIVILSDTDFKKAAAELPVIARNCLENGMSQNLWYEEVVPRETRFWFSVKIEENDAHFLKFENVLAADEIQIGANASIGYGFTKISKIAQEA